MSKKYEFIGHIKSIIGEIIYDQNDCTGDPIRMDEITIYSDPEKFPEIKDIEYKTNEREIMPNYYHSVMSYGIEYKSKKYKITLEELEGE